MKYLLAAGLLFLGGCVCLGRCEQSVIEIHEYATHGNYVTKFASIPADPPKFKEMILKPIDGGPSYRWECEYGVMTGTVTIDGSYLLESIGCNPKPEAPKTAPIQFQCPNNFLIPTGQSQQLNLSTVNYHIDLQ